MRKPSSRWLLTQLLVTTALPFALWVEAHRRATPVARRARMVPMATPAAMAARADRTPNPRRPTPHPLAPYTDGPQI
jgi:hypothetical protein